MFVVFEFKDKQYKVSKGDVIKVPRIEKSKKDDSIVFDKILFINSDETGLLIGSPFIKDFSVMGKVIEQIRDKKIIVFKKKRRHNYRRKNGHRQNLTLIKIEDVKSNSNSKQKVKSENKENLSSKAIDKKKEDINGT
ncbi:MAG: 50S ribosomal protein L21 [Rickettsiales bacterium]|nr:50S ribosomal protein L21 [Rickettsiales bacterium]|tara:strand:+ start:153 stop:563 length:411 start_codon:yes stop_codon:yes gene_type:complete